MDDDEFDSDVNQSKFYDSDSHSDYGFSTKKTRKRHQSDSFDEDSPIEPYIPEGYVSDTYGGEFRAEFKAPTRYTKNTFDKESTSKWDKRKEYHGDTSDDDSASETDDSENDVKSGSQQDSSNEENDGEYIAPTENPKWYPPNYVTRKDWGSDEYEEYLYELQLATKVLITYSESDPCSTLEECSQSMRELQKRDKAEGLSDIKHNFYIGSDGNIYEGRGWLEVPDTPGMFEEDVGKLLAISLIGRRGQIPGDLRVKTFQDMVDLGKENWLIGPHARTTWLLREDICESSSEETVEDTLETNENVT